MKKELKPNTSLAPVPVVMLSCGEEGKENITTIAWTGILSSEPPMVYVSIRPNRYSHEIISKTKEFVINLPNDCLVYEVDYCGTKSGRQVDKFKEMNLTKKKANRTNTVLIEECPIQLECIVKEIKPMGSHDVFIAEVIEVQAEEEFLKENGTIDYAKANLLTFAGSDYLAQNTKVAQRGISVKEKEE